MSAPPTNLFHYTGSVGLTGILGEEQFWLTNVRYLNDSKEYELARGYLLEAIAGAKRAGKLSDAYAERLKEFTTMSDLALCIMSFCENGDLLSLWRGYCPHAGYSIGIKRNFLEALCEAPPRNGRHVRLVKCMYDEEMHKNLATKIISEIVEEFPALKGDTLQMPIAVRYAEKIMEYAPLVKDPSFQEEREWRLCVQPRSNEELTFRSGKSFLIPYVRLALGKKAHWKESVKQIFVGPTPHSSLSRVSVKKFLESHRYNSCEAPKESKVPYRTW